MRFTEEVTIEPDNVPGQVSGKLRETGTWPLIAVVGPTGSGKSELAVTLARRFGGEIVNFDSVQLYKGLDIGAAKLPAAQRAGVPHHLIDVADAGTELTAGAYAQMARPVLRQIADRDAIPILVGGTGLYLRALLDGLSPGPQRDEPLRQRLRFLSQRRPAALSRYLQYWDPASAGRIHPQDHQKLIRAIEMIRLTGRRASELQDVPRDRLTGFAVCKLGLEPDRAALYAGLNARAASMFGRGLLEETSQLLEAGIPPEAKALQSIGYRQAVAVLQGRISLEMAIAESQARTRQYAKRQLTWFHAESGVTWLAGFGAAGGVVAEAVLECQRFLGKLLADASSI